MKKYAIILVAASLFVTACQKRYRVTFDEKQLSVAGGRLLYRGEPLNGEVTREFGGINARQVTEYRDGREHGWQRTWSENGTLTEEREFAYGKKTGVHRGYFSDGKDRFYAEFSDDHYSGEFWSWHSNGKIAEFKKHTAEGKVLVHKVWRESGQIYFNQVFAENFESGMPGVKLCNTVKETVAAR